MADSSTIAKSPVAASGTSSATWETGAVVTSPPSATAPFGAVLLDAEGTLGRLYGAKSTPHMFVVAPDGTLAYQGAIDDKPTANKDDVKGARNYVREALAAVKAGKSPETATTRPYGCSIKYAPARS